jgi:hypothetical protein
MGKPFCDARRAGDAITLSQIVFSELLRYPAVVSEPQPRNFAWFSITKHEKLGFPYFKDISFIGVRSLPVAIPTDRADYPNKRTLR